MQELNFGKDAATAQSKGADGKKESEPQVRKGWFIFRRKDSDALFGKGESEMQKASRPGAAKQKHYSEAAACYEEASKGYGRKLGSAKAAKAAELEARMVECFEKSANAYELAGDTAGMKRMQDKLVSRLKNPTENDRSLLEKHAAASLVLGDYESSKKDYLAILGFAPDDIKTERKLRDVYLKSGDTDGAIGHYSYTEGKPKNAHEAFSNLLHARFIILHYKEKNAKPSQLAAKDDPELNGAYSKLNESIAYFNGMNDYFRGRTDAFSEGQKKQFEKERSIDPSAYLAQAYGARAVLDGIWGNKDEQKQDENLQKNHAAQSTNDER